MFYKSVYKPRFFGYSALTGLVLIADGILTLVVGPFGYAVSLYADYCVWNLRRDLQRRKVARDAKLANWKPKEKTNGQVERE